MANTVSDYLIDRLREWGVHRIYGYPGDGINGIMGALDRAEGDPRFIQVRHEEMAAFMACAHAKLTGEVGVCLATSGPGAVHLMNGLYDAKMDHQPVVAIMGQQARRSLGSFYQQEIDLQTLFKDLCNEYVQQVVVPSQLRHCVDLAMRVAMSRRTVTAIILPNDLQEMDAQPSPRRKHGSVYSSVGYSSPRVIPKERDLRRAAGILNQGQRVAMLVGAGALHAADLVLETADVLGCGIAKALLGKAVVPDDLPHVTGPVGLLGSKASDDMMRECDTLLMVGTSFPYSEFLPKEGQARGVQIDLDARMLGLRYPCEVNLHGDALLTLRELLPMLDYKRDRSWRARIEENVADWWKVLEARAMNDADPINPQRVFWELSRHLPDDVILTADSGSSTNWWARDMKVRSGMLATLSGNLATMGPAMPYAVAAKFAFPERPVLATVGDGAMQMNGNNVLITVAKYWKEWRNPQLVVAVLNNHDLNQVTWEQRVMEGYPKYQASQDLPDFPYAQYAESLGFAGIRVDRPEDIDSAWAEAFAARRPCLVEFVTDPEVPPLPPHITFEQAVHFWKSVLGGDVNAWGMIRQSFKDMVESYIPQSSR
jgi:pyruvate dehydrogenase (quinone)